MKYQIANISQMTLHVMSQHHISYNLLTHCLFYFFAFLSVSSSMISSLSLLITLSPILTTSITFPFSSNPISPFFPYFSLCILLSMFMKVLRCGPVTMFIKLVRTWSHLTPVEVAAKVSVSATIVTTQLILISNLTVLQSCRIV